MFPSLQISTVLEALRALPRGIVFDWRTTLDFLIVALLVYGFLALIKRSHARSILNGITILLAIYLLARMLNLYLTSLLFQTFFAFFVVIIVVIFQREWRNFFEWLYLWGRLPRERRLALPDILTQQLIETVTILNERRIGALIVVPALQPVDALAQGGVPLGGKMSVPLLLSIFDPSSPGHDGAVILDGDRVKKFGAHLPLAERFDASLGTRHRAAIGLSERSDALIIVASEERGSVSIAHAGTLTALASPQDIGQHVHAILVEQFGSRKDAPHWYSFLTHNVREKILAAVFTFLFWFLLVAQTGSDVVTRDFDIPIELRLVPPEYVVTRFSPDTLTVTLSGTDRDFLLFDRDALKAVVPVNQPGEGAHTLTISAEQISHPTSIAVVQFSPTTIEIFLEKKGDEERP